jgi:hypothetical protein
MAQAVSGRLAIQAIPFGYVAENVALGQVFLLVLRFSPVGIIPLMPHIREHSILHNLGN